MIAAPAAYPTMSTCHPAHPLRTAHRCAYVRATAAATTATDLLRHHRVLLMHGLTAPTNRCRPFGRPVL